MVATDTLAVSSEGKPAYYTAKAFILPHLRMIVAGTGLAKFLGKWFIKINDEMALAGIENLDFHAERELRALFERVKEEIVIPAGFTTTVYHFGFSEETGLMQAYAYRSSNGFQSEHLDYGFAVKPECTIPDSFEFPQSLLTMMEEQRAIQSRLPVEERVYIGGEVLFYLLTTNGFLVGSAGKFSDYDDQLEEIFQNCKSS